MKKQSVAALLLFLLIPLVSAAGESFQPDYPEMAQVTRTTCGNYQLLNC